VILSLNTPNRKLFSFTSFGFQPFALHQSLRTLVVNGVTYSRHQTIDGYTSWVDESGNTVYTYTGTDAPVEPTVDTPVYSDQGTTQVGTVSEAA
jgi:hypothetical protein